MKQKTKKFGILSAGILLALGAAVMPQQALADTVVSGSNNNSATFPAKVTEGTLGTAVGDAANVTNNFGIAVGVGATAGGTTPKRGDEISGGTAAIGYYASAKGNYSVAIGFGAQTTETGYKGVAIGDQAAVVGDAAIGIGAHTEVYGEENVALGYNVETYTKTEDGETATVTTAKAATGVGSRSVASGNFSSALGYESSAQGEQSLASGYKSNASKDFSSAIGVFAQATEEQAQAFGYGAQATGKYSLATGFQAKAKDEYAAAFGYASEASGKQSLAAGNEASASGEVSSALGGQSDASGRGATAVGYVSMATAEAATSLGYASATLAANSTAVGAGAVVYDESKNSAAFGYNAQAKSADAVAIGANSVASEKGTVSFGHVSTDTYYKYDEETGTSEETAYGSDSFATLVNVQGGTKKNEVATWDQLIGKAEYDAATGKLTFTRNDATTFDVTIPAGSGSAAIGDTTKLSDAGLGDNVTDSILAVNNKVDDLSHDINKVGAGAAALAALHPEAFDPADKWSFAVGYGHYKNANAGAIGAFFKPNADMTISLGSTIGNGNPMVNAGLSFKLGQRSAKLAQNATNSQLVQEVNALRAENAAQAQEIRELKAQMAKVLAKVGG